MSCVSEGVQVDENDEEDNKEMMITHPLVKVLSLYGNDFSKRFISAKS